MKKKNLIYLIVAIVLILVSLFVVLYENNVFSKPGKNNLATDIFAIKDSSKVTKVFLADMHGNQVLLSKSDDGWKINNSVIASQERIESLLSVMMNLSVKTIVPKTMQNTVNTSLSVGGIKVEVYEIVPKFTLFGIKFFEKERKVKTYYMGSATQDNVSNFASIVGYDEPYIVHVPGFRGFVTPQFTQFADDWVTRRVFETKITRIQTLESKDFINPEESFKIEKVGPRFFNVYNFQNEKLADYDTAKLINMLSEYRNKNFESIHKNVTPAQKDSILENNLWKVITLIDVDGKKTEMKTYMMPYYASLLDQQFDNVDETLQWSRDRFYAVVNGDESTLYRMQFYHFDRQMQPLSYFLDRNIP